MEGGMKLRVGYSILREIHKKEFIPEAKDYGLKEWEFEKMIRFLEKKSYLERVLRVGNEFSLKPAQLTEQGIRLLKDIQEKEHYEDIYPERKDLKAWVQADKEKWSNGAEEL